MNNHRILVIEDEPHVATYLQTLLEDHGYETSWAANGRTGMANLRQEGADLICLDITMPEQSGISFYCALKADPTLRTIPIVIVTAVTGFGRDSQSFRNFISDRRQVPAPEGFFSKPIDVSRFLETIARILRSPTQVPA